MNKREIIKLVLAHMMRVRMDGGAVVHMAALATDNDETTLGDLVDMLVAKER